MRKADEQGRICPDVRGQFAGHNVSYYDVARIPELIEQLSQQDEWGISKLVMHSQFGAGRIVASGALLKKDVSGTRVVQFMSHPSPLHVPVRALRHLLPASFLASQIGVNRKSFSKLAALRGIQPDYVSLDGRTGAYYDEGRVEEIRKRWFLCSEAAGRRSGGFVLDDDGEVARLTGWDDDGKAVLQYVGEQALVRKVDVARVRTLVSVRALARRERMSRYKLNRLLAAAAVHPAYRTAKTIYYEPGTASERLKMRLDREGSAVTLRELSDRTNVSAALLARKVRQGCILTISSAAHVFDEQEAQRVDQIVRGLHDSYSNLETSGVARWHRRGRSAQEVASWDLSRLIEVAQSVPSAHRRVLFDQVVWMCEGAGQKRFREALDRYFLLLQKAGSEAERLSQSRVALLSLAKVLPNGLAVERTRLALIASGTHHVYRRVEQNLRALALETGCETGRSYDLFRTRLDRKLAEFFCGYCSHGSLESIDRLPAVKYSGYAGDDLLPGAIIVSVTDRKPDVGVILSIIQQSWNAVAGCWDKRILVRFADGERRINPYAPKSDTIHRNPRASAVVLVRPSESGSLFEIIRSVLPGLEPCDQLKVNSLHRRAS